MATTTLPLAPHGHHDDAARIARARRLAIIGLWWHVGEAAVAIGAGIVAGSIALIAFGADSVVEMMAGFVLLWRLADRSAASPEAELRAQRLLAASFVVIAAYVGYEAVASLVAADEPDASWVGIGLSIVALAAMPPLARKKNAAARAMHSSATASEAAQTELCAWLAAALLVGLSANALLGWWWADPITALVIAAVALRESRSAWRGEACCAGGCPGPA